MIIRSRKYGHESSAYCIYWLNDKAHMFHFGSCQGLVAVTENDLEITDPAIGHDFEFVTFANGATGIAHKYLIANNLLDRLIEHEKDAFEIFAKLLGKQP